MLEIVSLGRLSIRRDGQPLSRLATRKAEALLLYLACTGRAHPREVLADLLWEEHSQEQALTNLRKAIAELRRELTPYVVITRQTVEVDASSAVWLDARELEAGLRLASQGQALSPAALTGLEQALVLYQGDFLAGFYVRDSASFEAWLLNERERLRRLVIDGLHRIVEAHLNQHTFSAGIVQATRLLQLDPLREEAHRQMMTLLALTGQRHDALNQYETCKRLLIDELGVAPAIETTALYESIQAGTVSHAPIPAPLIKSHGAETLSTLPLQNTPFMGRIAELAQIAERLADPQCRLLTLVGAGGIGKTRLALQAAYEHSANFAHGAHFAALAPVTSADAIVFAIGSAVDFSFFGQELPAVQLRKILHDKEMLLVLDNFEHLLAAAPLVADLITAAPRLKLLITSRERLNLLEEWVLPIEGMDYPQADNDRHAENFGAVQLFAYNARRVQARFSLSRDNADVVRICQLVEGMPLGIELAAAWVRMLPCKQIADQLAADLDFLASPLRNVPERHRSLRAVFDQSWAMLSSDERMVIAKLSVFRGGFDLQAAGQVAEASLETLAALTDKSLIRVDAEGRCYLHELLRNYAAEKLESAGQSAEIANRQLRYFLSLADQAEAELYGPNQIPWLDRLEIEHDNLGAALDWSLTGGDAEIGLRLGAALGWFWQFRSYWAEGYAWFDRLLAVDTGAPVSVRAKALQRGAELAASFVYHIQQGMTMAEEALRLSRAANDKLNIAWSLAAIGFADTLHGEVALEQALTLFRELGDEWGVSHALRRLALMIVLPGNSEQAAVYAEEGLALARAAGDKSAEAWSLLCLGRTHQAENDLAGAMALLQECLPLFQELRDIGGIFGAYLHLAQLAFDQHQDELSRTFYNKSLAVWLSIFPDIDDIGWDVANCLIGVAILDWRQTRTVAAAQALGAMETYFEEQSGAGSYAFDLEKQMAQIRPYLEDPVFQAAWAEGRQMTMRQAVAYILEKSHEDRPIP